MSSKIIKMFSWRNLVFLFVLTGLLFTSCNVESLNVQEPEDIVIKKVEGKKVYVSLMLPIENPNPFSIIIPRAEIEIYSGSQKLGKVFIEDKIKLKKKETAKQELLFELDLSDIMGSGLAMIRFLSSGKLPLEIKGSVYARVYLLVSKVDVSEKFEISLKDISSN